MRDFVRSQIDSYPGGKIVIVHGTQRTLEYYDGQKNHPINLSWVKSFYPSGRGDEAPTGSDRMWRIQFIMARSVEGENSERHWCYPPTEEGKARRDADLAYLHETFTTQCPKDNPRALR